MFDPSTLDLANVFGDGAKLAAAIVAIVAAVRRYIWKSLDGSAVALVSLGLGVAISLGGFLAGQYPEDWNLMGALVYGLTAGMSAVALVEGGRAVVNRQTIPGNATHNAKIDLPQGPRVVSPPTHPRAGDDTR